MQRYKMLLLENRAWSKEQLMFDKDFFSKMAKSQSPQFLWIGCSDSRVPANQITGTEPGDLFVHRNIANIVIEEDINLMSVVAYAVDHLKVKHIIICGHDNCGGVAAALSGKDFGFLNQWLAPLKNLCAENKEHLALLPEEKRVNWMVEHSVRKQVSNLSKTKIIQDAWDRNQDLAIHGWVYQLQDGLLREASDIVQSKEDAALKKSNNINTLI